ncbi:hypothetical protein E5676_scaffold109G00310 [Cucumis melo var. makuwa]|uniref:Uncharacterized protein n=1 Tax=Cucumis melo var. makuwa TaxID=1194695 RepID=A0A5A7TYZ7_CUCMM|nr:hypothetical protein E6C27_scaffold83G00270 [Cucumis melo var. makuwa]TYK01153.1 hypothetical protein E5676_scaffold109G00310 [Cucumis melo var. makuwa]
MIRVIRWDHSQPDCLSVSFGYTKDQIVLGVPLGSPKIRYVRTRLQIARVRERASSWVPLFRTLMGSESKGYNRSPFFQLTSFLYSGPHSDAPLLFSRVEAKLHHHHFRERGRAAVWTSSWRDRGRAPLSSFLSELYHRHFGNLETELHHRHLRETEVELHRHPHLGRT